MKKQAKVKDSKKGPVFEALPQPAQDAMARVLPEQAKGPLPSLTGLPTQLEAVEDTPSPLDLTGLKFKNFGGNNKDVTFEIQASSGVLFAESTNKVEVVGSGTGTLQVVGRRTDIQKFLKDLQAVTYLGAENVFGDGAATISLSASTETTVEAVTEIEIDISDTPDDLVGTDGDDTLVGDDGVNNIFGLPGDDTLIGSGGEDVIVGDAGDDVIRGGADGDVLEGGDGEDTLQYTDSTGGVTVSLVADAEGVQSATGGDATGDVVSGFENVYGSNQGDTITGDDADNVLFGYEGDDTIVGGAGDDVIRGGEGADTMDGGEGNDWLRYVDAASGVTIDLNADADGFQFAEGGEAEGDVISGFENVQGSDFGDTFTGDDGDNYFLGFGGDDTISGGGGNDKIRGGEGADTMDGGDGADQLQYMGSSAGVTVSLEEDGAGFQSAKGGDATGDVISNFEHVYASDHDDVLTGNDARNTLYGFDGNDVLNGKEGHDILRGGAGADEFHFDTEVIHANYDRIIDFESGLDTIVLDSLVFGGLSAGALSFGAFTTNADGLAATADHRIVYESDTGFLRFDIDGSGTESGVIFARLSSLPTIDAGDFLIV